MARGRLKGIKKPHPLGSVATRSGVSQLTVVAASSATASGSGVKISELPAADVANDTDQLEVNQSGTSRRLTLDQVSMAAGAATVASVAALKAITDRPRTIFTLGYTAANDGGGGPPWQWVAGSSAVADDFMVVSPAGSPTGRYIRQLQAGAAVSPKWAGCGLGAADDSAQFLKVIAFGRAVDASGGTYPVNLTIPVGSPCPGIFSDGTAVFVPIPGATSSMNVLVCNKIDGFFFRNLTVTMPIGTASTSPDISTGIFFSATAAGGDAVQGDHWEVTGCRITGGRLGIATSGRTTNGRFSGNFVTGTWLEGIQVTLPTNCHIDDNQLIDSGVATAGGAGAIRIGGTASTQTFGQVSICRNIITRCMVAGSQSAIDCYTGSLSDVNISDNVCTENGSGIELKTSPPTAPGPGPIEIYQNITVAGNTIVMRPTGTGIYALHTGVPGPDYLGKSQNISIVGNHISCRPDPSVAVTTIGIICDGQSQVSIKSNFVLGVNNGIQISGAGVVGAKSYDIDISDNTIDTLNIGMSCNTTTGLRIHNNPLIKGRLQGVQATTGALIDLSMQGNFLWGVNQYGMLVRDLAGGRIAFNTFVGGVYAIYSDAGTATTNCIIENNRLRNTWDGIPAVSGTVTAPGAGLTNGTRIFTVTSGTGTVATRFSCVVVGGAITGPVVILEPGSYSVFPGVPTVTVDSGIVGGATFTLTGAVADTAVRVNVGTFIVHKNTIDIPVSKATLTGAGAYTAAENVRGMLSAAPVTTAGSLGDTFLNSAPTAAGVRGWICTTAGTTATAVWKGLPINA